MPPDFDYDVFLSHSNRDKRVVHDLVRRLKKDGLKVGLDAWEIKPGEPIGVKLEQGLKRSRTLVLILSANTFAPDWVTLERHTVLFRDPTNAQRRFIPVRIDDAEIEETIRQFAYIDWRKKAKKEYAKLLVACRPAPAEGTPSQRIPIQIPAAVFTGHTDSVNSVAVTPDGRRAVSGAHDSTLRVGDLGSGECLATLRRPHQLGEGNRGDARRAAGRLGLDR
jgi:hypothetical protein